MTDNDPVIKAVDRSTGHTVYERASVIDANREAFKSIDRKAQATDEYGNALPTEYATPSGSADSGQKADDNPPKGN